MCSFPRVSAAARPAGRRVLCIGLDSATFDLILPWAQQGLLPTFSRLLAEGTWGRLRSTLHPLSPPAWCSFMTGKNPGKHGIFDFVVHKPGSYELLYTNGGLRRGKSLWRILSDVGRQVVVANVPMTWPPEPVNGVLISGFDAPGLKSDFTYPPDVYREVTKELGEYLLRDYPFGETPETFVDQIRRILDFRRKLCLHLMQEHPWDFFCMVFGALDVAQHAYWQYLDDGFPEITEEERSKFGGVIQDTYQRVDAVLAEILDTAPDDTDVVILSDHGSGPCHKAVFVNKWLEQLGYLRYKDQEHGAKGSARALALWAMKQVHHGLKLSMPPAGLEWLKRQFPGLRRRVKSQLVFSEIDWAQTRAYSFGRESTSIFINQCGRFPQGAVEPGAEYEKLRAELTAALLELRDPDTGEPAAERVLNAQEVYSGDCMGSAPDLLVTWRDSDYTAWPGYQDRHREVFEPSLRHSDYSDCSQLQKGGNHRPEGIVILHGPSFADGPELAGARIVDLAPTILHALRLPIPTDMDGRVLAEAFRPEAGREPVEYVAPTEEDADDRPADGYSAQESAQIEERLRGLGYLE